MSDVSPSTLVMQMFITGTNPKSVACVKKLQAICGELPIDYRLEIIDLLKHPDQAVKHQIMAVPTLIRRQPLPVRRIIGDFSDVSMLLQCLEVDRLPIKQESAKSSRQRPRPKTRARSDA